MVTAAQAYWLNRQRRRARREGAAPPITFAEVLALGPGLAFSAAESGSCFQERTGASATTPSSPGDAVGSFKNFGSLGGWVTALTDAARPILRSSGALRYLEYDAFDDLLFGALAAFRAVAGWTLVAGVRNTGSTASSRTVALATTSSGLSRANISFALTTGNVIATGRRQAADSAATATGSPHPSEDIVLTGIGDYINTDAFVRVNRLQEGQNTSWLTAGNSDNDAGDVYLGAGGGASSPLGGRLYSLFGFPSVLSAANLALVERYTAQLMGLSV